MRKTKTIIIIVLIGFICALGYHFVHSRYLKLDYPHNSFLFIQEDQFNDFFNPYTISESNNPYLGANKFHSNYFPFANTIFYIFSNADKWAVFSIYSAVFIFFTFFTVYSAIGKCYEQKGTNNNYDRLIGAIILTFFSYPVLFIFDRGNIEGLLFIFLVLSIACYNNKKFMISAILLSLAISMKLYPAVFLLVYFCDKKYKEAFICIILVSILSLLCLLTFDGGFYNNLDFILSGFDVINNKFAFSNKPCMQSGVSLFHIMKVAIIKSDYINNINMNKVEIWYFVIVIILTIILSLSVIIEKEMWKKLCILTIMMLILPFISADYKLIYIYIPLIYFLQSSERSRFTIIYMILFPLLLIPKQYWVFSGIFSDSGIEDITSAVIIDPMIMITILIFIIYERMTSDDLDEMKWSILNFFIFWK